ncbi:hypothetical protein ACGF0D_37735 [Kitasatospora sp. NPDC048298]|uniref:hypothetical protein n=1 Tax=Kitasatospora sp. NPDC048298 TaxID=3364049 RepID=UPI00371A296B
MSRPFGPLSYTCEESAAEHEATAATRTGTRRLKSMALAARDWTDAEFHERALALLDEVAAVRPTFRKLKWALPEYASALFTAGRTEEAWAAVEAAEKHARKAGGSDAYEDLADCLAAAGHPERAAGYYTAALELLLLHGDDPNPARPGGWPRTGPIPRIRAARHRQRELLGPSRGDDRSARVGACLDAVRSAREGHPPGDRTARSAAEPAHRELIANLAATVEVTDPTDPSAPGTPTHLVLKLPEKRDEWRLALSASGPFAMLLRVTTAAPRRFRRLRVEPVEPAATDTERAILDTVLESGRTMVRAEDAEAAVTWSGPLGEPVDGPLYQALFGTLPGTGSGLPWRWKSVPPS